jgi:hypothetical protein
MKTKSWLFLWRTLLLLLPAALLVLARTVSGEGIPEPNLICYGEVRNNNGGQTVRLTSGTLVWTFHPVGGGSDVVVTTQLTNLLDQFSYMMEVRCEGMLGNLQASSNALKFTTPPTTYDRTNVTLDGQPVFLTVPAPADLTLGPNDRGRLERVDLQLVRQEPDSDGDGLPDWWENLYFGGNADPNADPDHDGVSNLREYVAGTDPTDPNSLFEFIKIEALPAGETKVQWRSMAAKTYTLLRSATLSANPAQFIVVRTGIPATPPLNTFTNEPAPGSSHCFYLLKVE